MPVLAFTYNLQTTVGNTNGTSHVIFKTAKENQPHSCVNCVSKKKHISNWHGFFFFFYIFIAPLATI